MLQKLHYKLLDRLRFGESAVDRNQALKELIVLEEEGKFEEEDFNKLLEDQDIVFQLYAMDAMGRQKIQNSIPKLKSFYLNSNNPLILSKLLENFLRFGTGDFVDVVIKRLKKPIKKKRLRLRNKKIVSLENFVDHDFILDQIIIPSLKYLQLAGTPNIKKKSIESLLVHEDPDVRWHTLVVYEKLSFPLKIKKLEEIQQTDQNVLVREQAAIMLAKKEK